MKTRQTEEELGRQHQGMDTPRVRQVRYGGNWLWNHPLCPNDPRGWGIDDDDDDNDDDIVQWSGQHFGVSRQLWWLIQIRPFKQGTGRFRQRQWLSFEQASFPHAASVLGWRPLCLLHLTSFTRWSYPTGPVPSQFCNDDTQLSKSWDPEQYQAVASLTTSRHTISDVRDCMDRDILEINEDKTEMMLTKTLNNWLFLCPSTTPSFLPSSAVPAGSPSRVGDVVDYVKDINQPSLPTSFYSVLVSISVFMALSTISHSINSPDNSPLFSLSSSGLNSALLVLSTIYFFMKVSLSPDIIICGWLGLKHNQLSS